MANDSFEALRRVALSHFASVGFEGASLQRIATEAGLSKSSVLYHFESKEGLLDAALRPGIDALRELVASLGEPEAQTSRGAFLERFVDFLFTHRLAVITIVNHGPSMRDAPAIVEADRLVTELSMLLHPEPGAELDAVRFGVAMAGATFVLVAADRWLLTGQPEPDMRESLTLVLAELVLASPVPPPVGTTSRSVVDTAIAAPGQGAA